MVNRVKFGQESVWDYPRPGDSDRRIKVVFGGVTYIAGPIQGGPGTRGW